MNMPTHAFPISEYEMHCDICGDNSYHKTRNYNRVVSWMANGMLLSKDVFTLMHAINISDKFEHKIPTADDLEILNNIFKVIKNCPENLSAPKFEIYLGKQKVLKSNRDERQNLLETLGYMGILESNDHKGFNRHFTNMSYQNEAIRSPRDEYEYPLRWWKVEDGLNKEAVDFWFGKYEKQLVH